MLDKPMMSNHNASSDTLARPEIIHAEGLVDYPQALAFMEQRVAGIIDGSQSECLWFLEHPPLYTAGTTARPEDLIEADKHPVYESQRGGEYTYHGPGQIVIYVLCDIRRAKLGVRDLVTAIETAIIDYLSALDIQAVADPKAPGVYVDGEKIAALGLKISRGCSYHGLSLNIDPDLEHFGRINPCGYAGLQVTSLARLLGDNCPGQAQAAGQLVKHLQSKLPLR